MATFKDIDDFFKRLNNDFARRAVPRIIAEKATEFYKQRFTVKADPNGVPWQQTQRAVKRGSLMVRSGKLMASVKPSVVTAERVIISAGSSKVPYAKAHNKGETITIPVTDKMRKFAWAMAYKTGNAAKRKKDVGLAYQSDGWKGLALTKKKTITIKLPKQQFMGHSKILNGIFMDSFKKAFKSLF